MIIITLTDIHAHTGAISALAKQLRSADLVLLSGDITHFGHKKEMAGIVGLIRTFNPSVFAVSGNCDYPDAEEFLTEERISLNGLIRECQGCALYGMSGSLPCPGKTPNEYSEEEFDVFLRDLTLPPGLPQIMLSHQPPYDTINDQVSPGVHVGSKSIRKFIEEQQPLICFTGHIHEGTGIDHIGNTAIVNPGPAGKGSYVLTEISGGRIKKLELAQPLRG
jgi:Icc-related predicted phosphoesterase